MSVVAGDLRYRIKIIQYTVTRDPVYGSEVITPVEIMEIRAAVKHISGTKGIDLKEVFASQVLQFTTYYRAIDSDMEIEHEGKRYRILSIAEIGYREGLNINAELINS